MAGIHKAAVHAYVQNGICRADEKLLSYLQAIVVEVFHRRHAEYVLEAALCLADAYASTVCNLLEIDFFVKMPMQEIQHCLEPFCAERLGYSLVGEGLVFQKQLQESLADKIANIIFIAWLRLCCRLKGFLHILQDVLVCLLGVE